MDHSTLNHYIVLKRRINELLPECPWRAWRYRIFPELSEQYWYLLVDPPPAAKQAFQRSSDQCCECVEWFRGWKIYLVEFNCSIFFPLYCLIVSKKTDHFLREIVRSESFSGGSMSIHLLSCIGMIVGVSTGSLCCGFLIFFWITSDLNRSHIWSFHNIFGHKIENYLVPQTKFEFQSHVCRTDNWSWLLNSGPILMFPWNHPSGCEAGSFRGRVYSRQATERNCPKSPVSLVMKYCPNSTTRINPASIQNLLNWSCCDNFSIRTPFGSSQSNETFVLIALRTIVSL